MWAVLSFTLAHDSPTPWPSAPPQHPFPPPTATLSSHPDPHAASTKSTERVLDSWNNHHLSLDVSDSCRACPVPSPSHPPVASQSIHSSPGTNSYFPPPCLAYVQPTSPRGFHSPLHLSPSCTSCWDWIFQLYFWILSTAFPFGRQLTSPTCLASLWLLISISKSLQWQVQSYSLQPVSFSPVDPSSSASSALSQKHRALANEAFVITFCI